MLRSPGCPWQVRTPVGLKGRATVGDGKVRRTLIFLSWVGWFDRQDERSEHELMSKVGSLVSTI